jgi:hypothetical protein
MVLPFFFCVHLYKNLKNSDGIHVIMEDIKKNRTKAQFFVQVSLYNGSKME